ncbi:MAG: hypothetical protein KUG81_03490 [Gammaproteobacteria bacterium]|nr:hypothetical protein [Gammaproteobacteria bacterium]
MSKYRIPGSHVAKSNKEDEIKRTSESIAKDIAEFEAKGNVIQQCPTGAIVWPPSAEALDDEQS